MRCRECKHLCLYSGGCKCELDNKIKFIKIVPGFSCSNDFYTYEHIGLCKMEGKDKKVGE